MAGRRDFRQVGGASLDEVAQVLGISREGARQVEERALRKLRLHFISLGLKLSDLAPEHGQEQDIYAPDTSGLY